jgi:putative transposase
MLLSQGDRMAFTRAFGGPHRFGNALNLNVHFHMLFLDGGYVIEAGRLPFLGTERDGVGDGKRQGWLVCDGEQSYLNIAEGEERGCRGQAAGFSLHAGVAAAPEDSDV